MVPRFCGALDLINLKYAFLGLAVRSFRKSGVAWAPLLTGLWGSSLKEAGLYLRVRTCSFLNLRVPKVWGWNERICVKFSANDSYCVCVFLFSQWGIICPKPPPLSSVAQDAASWPVSSFAPQPTLRRHWPIQPVEDTEKQRTSQSHWLCRDLPVILWWRVE